MTFTEKDLAVLLLSVLDEAFKGKLCYENCMSKMRF
jgi:hypothetical protein